MIKDDTREAYISKGGAFCPYCDGVNVSCDEPLEYYFDGTVRQKNFCIECKKEWWEVYELTGIEEVEDVNAEK